MCSAYLTMNGHDMVVKCQARQGIDDSSSPIVDVTYSHACAWCHQKSHQCIRLYSPWTMVQAQAVLGVGSSPYHTTFGALRCHTIRAALPFSLSQKD